MKEHTQSLGKLNDFDFSFKLDTFGRAIFPWESVQLTNTTEKVQKQYNTIEHQNTKTMHYTTVLTGYIYKSN